VSTGPSVAKTKPVSNFDLEQHRRLQFSDPKYLKGYTDKVAPLSPFFKILTKCCTNDPKIDLDEKHKRYLLKIWLPDTIVFSKRDVPTWYYSNEEGFLLRTQNFALSRLRARFGQGMDPNKAVAVLKRTGKFENKSKLITSLNIEEVMGQLKAPDCETVMQRFVFPMGNQASIIRCVYQRNRPLQRYVMVNRKCKLNHKIEVSEQANLDAQYLATFQKPENVDVVALKASACPDLPHLIRELLEWIAVSAGLLFHEFVADFIRDRSGVSWLLQVKAFQLIAPISRPLKPGMMKKLEPQMSKMKRCGLCECTFARKDLPYETTHQDISECHEFCRRLAMPLSWSFLQVVVKKDSTNYGVFRLCEMCQGLNTQRRTLCATVEQFAPIFNANSKLCKEMLKRSSSFPAFQRTIRGVKESQEPHMPLYQQFEDFLPVESACTVIPKGKLISRPAFLRRPMLGFRFLVYLNEIRDISDVGSLKKFEGRFEAFGAPCNIATFNIVAEGKSKIEHILKSHLGVVKEKEEENIAKQVGKRRLTAIVQQNKRHILCLGAHRYRASSMKIRAIHLFAESREALEAYAHTQPLRIHFWDDKQEIGKVTVDIRRFLPSANEESTCKQVELTIQDAQSYFNYATCCFALGFDDGRVYDTEQMDLTRIGIGVWRPHADYSCMVPLSPTWMELLTEKP